MSVLRKTDWSFLCDIYDFKNLIKWPTCHKSFENVTYIGLMFKNVSRSFYSAYVVETGVPDFHFMIWIVIRKV